MQLQLIAEKCSGTALKTLPQARIESRREKKKCSCVEQGVHHTHHQGPEANTFQLCVRQLYLYST